MKDLDPLLLQRVRVMQIINVALISGVVLFLGVVLWMRQSRPASTGEETAPLPVLTLVAAGVLITEAVVALILPGTIIRQGLQSLAKSPPDGHVVTTGPSGPVVTLRDREYLLGLRQTSFIIFVALFEGVAFLGLVAFLVEGAWPALLVSLIAVLPILWSFPTLDGVRQWLEQQQQVVTDLRARQAIPGE